MGRKQTIKVMRQRMNYYKRKGYDQNTAVILGTSPEYVRKEFKLVKKLHGKKHAVSWLKGKYKRHYSIK